MTPCPSTDVQALGIEVKVNFFLVSGSNHGVYRIGETIRKIHQRGIQDFGFRVELITLVRTFTKLKILTGRVGFVGRRPSDAVP